jgi:hypothetical protein
MKFIFIILISFISSKKPEQIKYRRLIRVYNNDKENGKDSMSSLVTHLREGGIHCLNKAFKFNLSIMYKRGWYFFKSEKNTSYLNFDPDNVFSIYDSNQLWLLLKVVKMDREMVKEVLWEENIILPARQKKKSKKLEDKIEKCEQEKDKKRKEGTLKQPNMKYKDKDKEKEKLFNNKTKKVKKIETKKIKNTQDFLDEIHSIRRGDSEVSNSEEGVMIKNDILASNNKTTDNKSYTRGDNTEDIITSTLPDNKYGDAQSGEINNSNINELNPPWEDSSLVNSDDEFDLKVSTVRSTKETLRRVNQIDIDDEYDVFYCFAISEDSIYKINLFESRLRIRKLDSETRNEEIKIKLASKRTIKALPSRERSHTRSASIAPPKTTTSSWFDKIFE